MEHFLWYHHYDSDEYKYCYYFCYPLSRTLAKMRIIFLKSYCILTTFLLSLYTNLIYFFLIWEIFFTKSAAKFRHSYAARFDLSRGIIFSIPTFLCYAARHVIVKIAMNNNFLFAAFHITMVHYEEHISLFLAVLFSTID